MKLEKFLNSILVLALAIFFLLLNANIIAIFPSTYSSQVDKLNITESDKSKVSKMLFEIINFGTSENLILNNGEYAFSEKEIIHLMDVYKIFKITRIICMISLIIAITIIFILARRKIKFLNSFLISSLLIFIFGVAVAVSFNSSFILFHLLSFNNDFWLLNPETDLLINIFPQAFFFNSFIAVILSSIIELLIINLLFKRYSSCLRAQYL